MIPLFPGFKKLELTDKPEIEQITSKFEPYSDFNFVSLWSWDVDESTQITNINGNLGVQFLDYMDGSRFWSFIGDKDVITTTKMLKDDAKNNGGLEYLKLIPEIVANKIMTSDKFKVTEDIDNNDYILSVQNLCTMSGNKLGPKRNFVNRFNHSYGNLIQVIELDINTKKAQKEISDNFLVWEKSRDKVRKETEREFKAIGRIFMGSEILKLHALGFYLDRIMVGFSICEILGSGYGVIHFEKADVMYVGLFEFIKQQEAVSFAKHGCTFINYEQDLGLPGLRGAKMSYRPVKFLKKYLVS